LISSIPAYRDFRRIAIAIADLIAVLAIGPGAAIGRKPGIHHFFPSISLNPKA
jgi:hypothetical protein